MAKAVEDYLKEPYTKILIQNEDGVYSAEILELSGCFSVGNTPNEAIQNLDEVAKSWIETSIELGQEIPEPFVNQGYSGKIALRLPRSLHRQAIRVAEREGVSLNQFLITAIASRLGADNFYTQLIEKLQNRFVQAATAFTNRISLNPSADCFQTSNKPTTSPSYYLPEEVGFTTLASNERTLH